MLGRCWTKCFLYSLTSLNTLRSLPEPQFVLGETPVHGSPGAGVEPTDDQLRSPASLTSILKGGGSPVIHSHVSRPFSRLVNRSLPSRSSWEEIKSQTKGLPLGVHGQVPPGDSPEPLPHSGLTLAQSGFRAEVQNCGHRDPDLGGGGGWLVRTGSGRS